MDRDEEPRENGRQTEPEWWPPVRERPDWDWCPAGGRKVGPGPSSRTSIWNAYGSFVREHMQDGDYS